MPEERVPTIPRLPGLDGLRAIAVVLVTGFHLETKRFMPGGFIGVDLFFVLSGFLISTLLISEYQRDGRIDLPAFYARRLRRLLPAFVLTLVLVLALSFLVFEPNSRFFRSLDAMTFSVVGAFTYVFNWLPSLRFPYMGPLVHLWSLAVEEQFYLLWPAALFFCLRRSNWRSVLRRVLPITILVSLSIPFWYWNWDWRRLYYSSDYRAHAILAGALLAVLRSDESLRVRWSESKLLRPMTILSCVYLLGVTLTADIDSAPMYVGGFAGVVLASAVLIFSTVESRPDELGRRFLESPALVWIGHRCYGFYLFHMPIMVASYSLDLTLIEQLLWVMGLTLLLTEASYRYVERPIIERRGPSLGELMAPPRPIRALSALLHTGISGLLRYRR